MKKRIKQSMLFMKYYSKTRPYYFWILFAMFFSMFISVTTIINLPSNISTYDLLITIFENKTFLLLTIIIYLINSLSVVDLIKNNRFYTIECNTKKELMLLIINIFIVQSFIFFIIQLLSILIIINIITNINLNVNIILDRGIPNVIYCFWYIIRYFVWILLICILLTVFAIKSSEKLSLLFSFIVILYIFFDKLVMTSNNMISTINEINIKIPIFFHSVIYSSFIFELFVSFLYILLTILLIMAMLKYDVSKRMILIRNLVVNCKLFIIYNIKRNYIFYISLIIICFFSFNLSNTHDLTLFKKMIGFICFEGKDVLFILLYFYITIYFIYNYIHYLYNNRKFDKKYFLNAFLNSVLLSLILYVTMIIPFLYSTNIDFIELLSTIFIDFILKMVIIMITFIIKMNILFRCKKKKV